MALGLICGLVSRRVVPGVVLMLVPVGVVVAVPGTGQLAVWVHQPGQDVEGPVQVAFVLQHDVGCLGEHRGVKLGDAENTQRSRPVDGF